MQKIFSKLLTKLKKPFIIERVRNNAQRGVKQ